MNFIRPLDLSAKTNISDDGSGAEGSPVWCDSLLNVKAIISNHELLLDWGNEDVTNTGPWRWRYERSPPFLSLKRKVSEIVNEEAEDIRGDGDDERSGPSDDPDFFVFNFDYEEDESARNKQTNSSLSIEKRDPMNELNKCWSEDSYSSGDENFCWRFDCDSLASSILDTLEMLLEDLDLNNCLREVDPELEPITRCIEVSCYDERDEEEDPTPVAGDPDIDMFSSIKEVETEDITSYENLLEDLGMSDDDDEKDSGINEENGDTLTLMEDDSVCSIPVLRENTFKDYSQVKAKSKCKSIAYAVNTKVVTPKEEFRINANSTMELKGKVSGSFNKSQDKIESEIQENVEEVTAIRNHRHDQTSKATLNEGIPNLNLQENQAISSSRSPSSESPCRKKLKCDSGRTISVNGTDIPDLSELLNRDSGLGDTPNDGLECFSDSDHDDLLIVCD